jgi:hypothetical protein
MPAGRNVLLPLYPGTDTTAADGAEVAVRRVIHKVHSPRNGVVPLILQPDLDRIGEVAGLRPLLLTPALLDRSAPPRCR